MGITLPDATGTVITTGNLDGITTLASNVVIDTSGTVDVSGTTTLTGTVSMTGNAQIGNAATDTLDIQSTITSTSLIFEGATADNSETTLAITDPTTDRTI